MTLYHGTNYEAAKNIIENGFNSPSKIWSCSDTSYTYVVATIDDDEDFPISFAIDAAKTSAAHFDSNSNSVCVFKFEMSDEIFEDEFLPDISCENMTDCYCIDSETLNNLVDTGKIKMTMLIVEDAYNKYLRPFYLAGLSDYYVCKEPLLEKAINCLKDGSALSSIVDDLYEYGSIEEIEILPKFTELTA